MAAVPLGGLDPYFPAMLFDDFFADCQSDPVARIFGSGMEALEYGEDHVRAIGGDADSVVGYGEEPIQAGLGGAYVDGGFFLKPWNFIALPIRF